MRKLAPVCSAVGRGIGRRWWLPVLAVVALAVPLASSSEAAADGGPSADVSVAASADFDSVTLTVTNNGPDTASGLTLTVSGGQSLGADAGTCGSGSCSLDTLASTHTWTVTASTEESCGPPVTVSGTVTTTSSDDPNQDNNTDSADAIPTAICVGCTVSLDAFAGDDQTVSAGDTVTLAGSPPLSPGGPVCSSNSGGTDALWTQASGTPVVLDDPHSLSPTFTAPSEPFNTSEVLTFRFTETADGADPASDTVDITVEGPADTTPPTVDLVTPGEGSIYRQGQSVLADYTCHDDVALAVLAGCIGTVDDGQAIDTSSLGWHTFTVTAKDAAGHSTPVTHHYYVTVTSTSKAQSWGNVKVAPGTTVHVGYDFSLAGKHPAASVRFVGGQVAFAATCVSGGAATMLVVPIDDVSYGVSLNSTAWYPSGDQGSSLVYQGTLAVPTLCGGGQILLGQARFSAGILASKSVKLTYRWHYNVSGVGGGWSGTTSLTPDLLPTQ